MRGELNLPVEVRLGACLCAGTPHLDGDVVYLAAKLPTPAGHAAVRALSQGGDLEVTILAGIIRYSIVGWNFVDDKGNDVSVTPDNVDRYLPWNEGGKEVAAEARKQYMAEGNGPFSSSTSRRTSKNSSPPSPTGAPTSRTPRSSSKHQSSRRLQSVPASAGPQSATSP